MAMYFFDLQGYDGSDTEEAEFPNDEAARREAVSVARDFARNNLARYGSTRIIVRNAKGEVIHEEPLLREGRPSN